jgi:hypothetical protein
MDKIRRRQFLSLSLAVPFSSWLTSNHVGGPIENDEESTTPDYDLFAVGGQSNAVGRGDATASPDPDAGTAVEYRNDIDDIQDPLDDPVDGNADVSDTGSAWPQFCVDYYNHRSQPVAIVGAATGGAAQDADADSGNGNWDDTGSLDDDLITFVNNAISRVEANGDTATFRGVLWHQGERDAQAIDDGTITKADYKTAFENMIVRFRTEFGDQMPFWIFEVGQPDSGDTAGFQDVRAAQQEVAVAQEYTSLVSDQQKEFPTLGYMSDDLHYNQTGYNLMGEVGAVNVAARVDTSTRELSVVTGTESQNDSYTG